MNELSLTTPALLFSAISLIMLAYTNRFLAYAAVVRNLHAKYQERQDAILLDQIKNLSTTIAIDAMDADFRNCKFVIVCIDHVFNLH